MSYFRKETLVILTDCIIGLLLIGGIGNINAKTEDKIIPPVRVGKAVEKNLYYDPLIITKSPLFSLQLTSCIRTMSSKSAFIKALLTLSLSLSLSFARGLSSCNKSRGWISSIKAFFFSSTFSNTSLFQCFKSSFNHLSL
jgi:hypothetical protein